eukprot:Sro954_g224360.2  (371) ;mRNA; f:29652-30764
MANQQYAADVVFSMSDGMEEQATPVDAGEYLTSLHAASSPAGSGPTGYLDNIAHAAPQNNVVFSLSEMANEHSEPAAVGDYLNAMGGGSVMKASSLKASSPAGPAFGGSYLDNMRSGPVFSLSAMVDEHATPAAVGDYLNSMGGGSAMKASALKASSSAGPAFGGSYLDNIAGYAVPAGVTFSMSELFDENSSPVAADEYLTSLKIAAAPVGSGPVGYLDTLRSQAFHTAPRNLPGYLDTLSVSANTVMGGLGPMSYLDNIAGAGFVAAKVEATTEVAMVSAQPVLAAINEMKDNMSRNQEATIGILQEINSSVKQLVDATQAAPVQQVSAPAPTAGDYLSQLSANNNELVHALEQGAPASAGNYLASLR